MLSMNNKKQTLEVYQKYLFIYLFWTSITVEIIFN